VLKNAGSSPAVYSTFGETHSTAKGSKKEKSGTSAQQTGGTSFYDN